MQDKNNPIEEVQISENEISKETQAEDTKNTCTSGVSDENTGECAEDTTRGDKKRIKKLETQISELEKKITEAGKELSEAQDKYLRLYAEFDNYRKRSAKEKEGI